MFSVLTNTLRPTVLLKARMRLPAATAHAFPIAVTIVSLLCTYPIHAGNLIIYVDGNDPTRTKIYGVLKTAGALIDKAAPPEQHSFSH